MTPDQDLSARAKDCPFCGCPAITRPWQGTIEAGCRASECPGFDARSPLALWNRRVPTDHERAVQAAVAKAVEAERAECITIADDHMISHMPLVCDEDEWRADEAAKIAAAIRARKGDAP